MKSYIYFLLFCCFSCVLLSGCKEPLDKTKYGNCTDNSQNQNETRIDCGGVCKPCDECVDGVKNGSETGIDCGGRHCESCEPSCSVGFSTVVYTVTVKLDIEPKVVDGAQYWYSPCIYSKWENQIRIGFQNGTLTTMLIFFRPDFDLFSFVKIGETAVFKTVAAKPTIYNDNQIYILFYGPRNPGTILSDQSVYFTRLQDGTMQIRACLLEGDEKDRISLNGICTQ